MYKIIVFPSKVIADEMLLDVAATPNQHCWLWKDPDAIYKDVDHETGEVIIKQMPNQIHGNEAIDGRFAIAHDWNQDDLDWLQEYWADGVGFLNGILFLDRLPEGWKTSNEI